MSDELLQRYESESNIVQRCLNCFLLPSADEEFSWSLVKTESADFLIKSLHNNNNNTGQTLRPVPLTDHKESKSCYSVSSTRIASSLSLSQSDPTLTSSSAVDVAFWIQHGEWEIGVILWRWSRDSVWETEFALVWETQLESLNTNGEGGLQRIQRALLIPPGLDVPYFQVKCLLLQFSALWSCPAISLSIITFLPLFFFLLFAGRWRGC